MKANKVLFVYNAHAGQGRIRFALTDVLDIFQKAGYEVTVHPTQARGDATVCVKENDGKYDMVVCSGGDGTLDEVIKGMGECEHVVPIGYLPAGSTNDFGKTLGIPAEFSKAAKVIVDGKPFACDVGKFNGSPFIYIVAFGALTEVSYETNQRIKNVFGHLAYVIEGIKSVGMGNLKPFSMSIVANDQLIKDTFIYGMVSNTISIGGMRLQDKGVKLDDGEFEALFIKYPNDPVELNSLLSSLLAQEFDPEHIYYFRASEIHIKADQEIPWTVDGENGGSHKEVDIENLQKHVQIIAPENLPVLDSET